MPLYRVCPESKETATLFEHSSKDVVLRTCALIGKPVQAKVGEPSAPQRDELSWLRTGEASLHA